MGYNIFFLVASIFLMVLLFVHFYAQSGLKREPGFKLFRLIAWLGFADIAMDLVTALLLDSSADHSQAILYLANVVFFLLQLAIPAVLFLYTLSLCRGRRRQSRVSITMLLVPCGFMALTVLLTPLTHWVFFFDGPSNVYAKGVLFYGVHASCFLYAFLSFIYVIRNHAFLRSTDVTSVVVFVLLALACTLVQAFVPTLLVTGFGIALGITFFYFAFTDPRGLIDPATHLYNQAGFVRQVSAMRLKGQSYSLACFSLLHLKSLDRLGGSVKSSVLVQSFIDKLKSVAAPDAVYCLGNDRFIAVASCESRMRRIRVEMEQWLESSHEVEGFTYRIDAFVTCIPLADRIGEVDYLLDYLSFLTKQRLSGTLMPGKEIVEDDFRIYQGVKAYLPTAIREDVFEVCYQPLFDTANGRFSSVECLSRLKVPNLGYISPELFIQIGEEAGFLPDIMALQFERVCKFVEDHQAELVEKGVCDFKLNVSPSELVQADLAARILSRMEKHGLDPSLFSFEITESSAFVYDQLTQDLVEAVGGQGSRFYLDDFGSGHSNLVSVMALPFDGVKVDKSIVHDMMNDPARRNLCKEVIQLLKGQGFRVVCEGVECADEAALLAEWGADYLQGFYFSKPLPGDELLALIGLPCSQRVGC